MIKVTALFLAMCLTCAAQDSDEGVPKELIGVWKLESTSFKGAVPTKPDGIVWLVILRNGDFVIKSADDLQGGSVAVDASVTPAAIDLRVALQSGRPNRKWTNLGIYEIQDDMLTLAKAPEGKNRPGSLKSDSESVVQVFRRSVE